MKFLQLFITLLIPAYLMGMHATLQTGKAERASNANECMDVLSAALQRLSVYVKNETRQPYLTSPNTASNPEEDAPLIPAGESTSFVGKNLSKNGGILLVKDQHSNIVLEIHIEATRSGGTRGTLRVRLIKEGVLFSQKQIEFDPKEVLYILVSIYLSRNDLRGSYADIDAYGSGPYGF
jgi:hypothetical protein